MADVRDTRPMFASSNRIKVCAPCGKKVTVNQIRKISERENHLIQQFVNSSFDMDNAVYPIGLCSTCRNYLSVAQNSGDTSKLPKMLNYERIILPRILRNSNQDTICNCNICLTGRSKAKNKRISSETIDELTGLYGSADVAVLPNKEPVKKARTSITVCEKCRQEIGLGIGHNCKIACSSTNMVDQVTYLPVKQQEQVISSLLDKRIEGDRSKNLEIKLSTKGSKKSIILNPEMKYPSLIS